MWKEQTDVAPWSGPASLAVCELSFELQSFIMIVAQNYYATMAAQKPCIREKATVRTHIQPQRSIRL